MLGSHKLSLLWVFVLLLAALCPSAQARRGGGFRGRGKGVGMGSKVPPSQSRGSSKQGLKLAGAAAAGALGGAAVGYGLGSLGSRNHYGYGYGHGRGYGRGYDSSEEDRRGYYPEGPGFHNQSDYRYYRGAAGPGAVGSAVMVLAMLVPLVWVQWAGVV